MVFLCLCSLVFISYSKTYSSSFHLWVRYLVVCCGNTTQSERLKLPVPQEKTRVMPSLLRGIASFQASSLFLLNKSQLFKASSFEGVRRSGESSHVAHRLPWLPGACYFACFGVFYTHRSRIRNLSGCAWKPFSNVYKPPDILLMHGECERGDS